MTNDAILLEINGLPDDLKAQVLNYIRFLRSPYVASAAATATTTKKPTFGFGKFKLRISDDFDAPLDDFMEERKQPDEQKREDLSLDFLTQQA